MTHLMPPPDPDAILAAWLEEGPTQLPETTRRAIAVGLRSTRQSQRVMDVPRRPNIMNPFARLAVGAAAIVILAGGAFYLLSPGNQAVGGPPAASLSPSAEPSASPSGSPAALATAITEWQTVSSERFGYSVVIPAGWGESPPTNDLPPELFPGDPTQYANRWDAPQTRTPAIVIAVREPDPGESATDWLARTQAVFAADCDGTPPVRLTVDGETASRSSGTCLTVKRTVFVQFIHGGRIYSIDVNGAVQDQANLDSIMGTAVSSLRFSD
jgi:hypothetical protein